MELLLQPPGRTGARWAGLVRDAGATCAPGRSALTSFADRRDRTRFAAAYADPEFGITTGPRAPNWPVCVGPLTYKGHAAIAADIANFKAGLAACGIDEGFMTSIAPGSASRIGNTYYKTEDEFLLACADAMREEYQAIIDAGLILQLDDPSIAENWDMVNPEPTVEEYQAFSMQRVEALNHAIRGCRGIESGSISAGAVGMDRIPPTFRCATSSMSCWRSIAVPIHLRPGMCATNTNGVSGATSSYRTTG